MKRLIMVFVLALLMLAMLVANALPAFAQSITVSPSLGVLNNAQVVSPQCQNNGGAVVNIPINLTGNNTQKDCNGVNLG